MNKLLSFIPKEADFLDLGFGSGVLLYLADKKGSNVSGVDLNQNSVDFALHKIPTASLHRGDVRSINLGRQFDVVNCSDVIEHFYDADREQIYQRIHDHVKPGGTLILAFPSWFYLKVVEKLWFTIRNPFYKNHDLDDLDIHLWIKPKDIQKKFEQMGYTLQTRGNHMALVQYLVFKKHSPAPHQ